MLQISWKYSVTFAQKQTLNTFATMGGFSGTTALILAPLWLAVHWHAKHEIRTELPKYNFLLLSFTFRTTTLRPSISLVTSNRRSAQRMHAESKHGKRLNLHQGRWENLTSLGTINFAKCLWLTKGLGILVFQKNMGLVTSSCYTPEKENTFQSPVLKHILMYFGHPIVLHITE
jgi:hypothetical protein